MFILQFSVMSFVNPLEILIKFLAFSVNSTFGLPRVNERCNKMGV